MAAYALVRFPFKVKLASGIVFFVIFLYTKFYEWWWEIMPKYLFFLVIGLTAVLILLILNRLRRTFRPAPAEGAP